MKRIGLTGNIGSGKSTVSRIFETLGVPVYYADKKAHKIIETEQVKSRIVSIFGTRFINSDNSINRKALAEVVFSSPQKLNKLNNLIHPSVEEDFTKWCTRHKEKPYILHEAAILFESGFNRLFDATILVTAPEALCIKRVVERDGITPEMVKDRMRNQWKQDEKQKLADYLIVNDNVTMLIPQVLAVHQILNSK